MWGYSIKKKQNNNALNAVEKEFMTMETITMNEYIYIYSQSVYISYEKLRWLPI